MTETKAVALVAMALLVPAQAASAQLASRLEAGALVSGSGSGLSENAFAVRPSLRFDAPRYTLVATGSAWHLGNDWQLADGTASLALSSPSAYGLHAELEANASRIAYDAGLASDQLDARASVHMLFDQKAGIWLGGGIDRPVQVSIVSAVEVTSGGAWTRIGEATLAGSVTNFAFSKAGTLQDSSGVSGCAVSSSTPAQIGSGAPPGTSKAAPAQSGSDCQRQSRFSDIEGSLEWSIGPLEVHAQGGYRVGDVLNAMDDSRRWGGATATYWVSSQFAAVFGGGREPGNPARGLPARSFANLGVMLAYVPIPRRAIAVTSTAAVTVFQVENAGYGHRTLILRAGGVERVEVMGTFTDWEPRMLTRIGRDRWEITLPIDVGVHQINVRLDNGKWRPPPGLPAMRDGFNGDVGIWVVE
ncbi:MAG: hypothetical protein H0X64_10855 [Gemmatimonadaceae bacterium]|nr:hypothetical protein [Gemmatimonadaceae bacterium]